MKAHEYKVVNAEGVEVRRVITGTKSMQIAAEKVKARLGDLACFVKIEYIGEVELKTR